MTNKNVGDINTDRFKFRAWDPEDKQMLYGNVISYHELGFPVMQCTGRKDSKGNLVYEGDVLADATGEPAYVIKWRKAGFCGASVIGDIAFAIEGDFVGLTVLGNIYENPELLGKD